ncbi:MAG: substrate-binding domain-containing protein [Chitinophagales bacterium]
MTDSQKLQLILTIFFISFLFSSCNQAPQEKKFTIGFSQCCADPWRDVMNEEMYRELAFHPEINFLMKVANNNSQVQIEQIKELQQSDIDLLIVAPNESEPLTHIIEEIYESGIHVILIDRKTESEKYTAYVGADNYQIGKTAAQYLSNQFRRKGKIIELQLPLSISPAVERSNGFRDALKMHPEMELLQILGVGFYLENIEKKLPDYLRKYSDINIIFGHTDLISETAYKLVAKEMPERLDSLFFVGVDGIPGTGRGIEAVEEGILDISLLYPTGGGEVIRLALSILNNEPFDKKNFLQTTVIDSSNARILNLQFKKVASLQKRIDQQKSLIEALEVIYHNQQTFIFILISTLLIALLLWIALWRSLKTKQKINENLRAKNKEVFEQKEELLKKQEEIIKMSNEVEEATQAKVNFFTNISHEFRTPLTLILVFTEDLIIHSDNLDKLVKENIRPIRDNALRLLRLVNQLMDFRKVESNRMQVRAGENNLIEFVQNMMYSYYKIAEKRGIDFKMICKDENLMVWFDRDMIDKVLFNILSNAFKFTHDNGKISIIISVDTFEKLVKIKIEDNGRGMTEEEVKHIFEPFYQAENNNVNGGTGLGLSLSMALVKLNKGDIVVRSEKGHSTSFTILLPLGNAHFEKDQLFNKQNNQFLNNEQYEFETVERDSLPLSSFKTESEYKLLIVEDNEELLQFLHKKLSLDYQVFIAKNGKEGLSGSFEIIPDLIVCDIGLPEQDGLEITKILKSDLRTSHIPIILLTARSTIEQQIEGTKAGADSYITKPFNIQFLEEKIKNLLHNRQILQKVYSQDLIDFQQHNDLNLIDQEFVKKFITYVSDNFHRQDFQVADLCEELNISRSQLYRKIKALLDQSISDYIQNFRLKKAEELLVKDELSIAEIAYQVGYSSPDYFTKVFKSNYKVTPTQFRKN